ncbi:MAG: hypothetical protein R2856_07775 [Caldilineaceae bacterium]
MWKALPASLRWTAPQIADAVSSARDVAIQRGTPSTSAIWSTRSDHSSPNLGRSGAQDRPSATRTLPEDQRAMLREMIQTRRAQVVMESWGVGAKLNTSSGVTVLCGAARHRQDHVR